MNSKDRKNGRLGSMSSQIKRMFEPPSFVINSLRQENWLGRWGDVLDRGFTAWFEIFTVDRQVSMYSYICYSDVGYILKVKGEAEFDPSTKSK